MTTCALSTTRYSLDRRSFLKGLGTVAVATAAGPLLFDAYGGTRAATATEALAETLPTGTPICVQITLDGGNDALNTLVPVNDSWYYDATVGHGHLALAASDTLPLPGSTYQLHKNLPWLAGRWSTNSDVAFVVGVGENTVHSFSHFDAMKFWQTADFTLLEPLGWLGRFNDLVRPASPLAAVSLTELRTELVGDTGPVLVLRDTASFAYATAWYERDRFRASLSTMATGAGSGFRGQAAKLIGTTFDVSGRVTAATNATITDGATSQIAKKLLQAALLIRAGLPCQTYAAAYGPFDSHGDQLAMQGDRLTELNEALTRFFAALAGSGRESDVFVAIVSEFGRQVTHNASNGTDHGQGGLAILIGGGVKGGIYGEAPTLDPGGITRPNRINDALKPTVDFRMLQATILARLTKDSGVVDAVLRGRFENLGVFGATTSPPSPPPPTQPRITIRASRVQAGRQFRMKLAARPSDGFLPQSFTWDFGDGSSKVVAKQVVMHDYARTGSYTISVQASVQGGSTATATRTIVVEP